MWSIVEKDIKYVFTKELLELEEMLRSQQMYLMHYYYMEQNNDISHYIQEHLNQLQASFTCL